MAAYTNLEDILLNDNTGAELTLNQSLERVVDTMNFELSEIAEGEWNGMTIKDDAKIPSLIERSLDPVLRAAAIIANNDPVAQSAADLKENFGNQSRFRGFDFCETENKLIRAVNQWLAFVESHELKEQIAKPLAINCEARQSAIVTRLTDFVRLPELSYHLEPRDKLTDAEATDLNKTFEAKLSKRVV